jgi:hypothetical protein
MLASSIPSKIQLPFASSGSKNTIPVPSQISITPGAASFTDGFPPLNLTPIASGGIPPDGLDMNGILNQITAVQQWQSAGGSFKYDSTFSIAIGGYPAGAVLLSTDGLTEWLNTTDNNVNDPNGATPTGWIPLSSYGATTISGLTNTNVTLTATQYKSNIIFLTGTLTGNVQIIMPTLYDQWLIINNTTGAFTVTVKTASGTGVVAVSGATQVFCEGTNIISQTSQTLNTVGIQGSFKNLQASSTGLSANVLVLADEIIVENISNAYQTLRNVSLTIAGTSVGANALDNGTIAASTWYSVWVIWNGTTTAGLLSLSATAPTMPSGYTHKARVGWIRTDASGNKYPLSFIQFGRKVQYKVVTSSNVANIPILASGAAGNVSTPTWVAVGIGNYVPSTASQIDVLLNAVNQNVAMAAPNNAYGAYTSTTNPPPMSMASTTQGTANAGFGWSYMTRMMTIESANIYWASGGNGLLAAMGWEDNI